MSKDSIFFEQPIFGQMVSLLDKEAVIEQAGKHKSDHYCK